jgi:hypothetical protein
MHCSCIARELVSTTKEFPLVTTLHFSRGATVATRRTKTIYMKQKHLIEIPEEVTTALMITRHEDGKIGLVSPKGEPGMMEVMALTFGVFVSILQGGEQDGIVELQRLRDYIQSHSLEQAREKLVQMAVKVKLMEDEDNE